MHFYHIFVQIYAAVSTSNQAYYVTKLKPHEVESKFSVISNDNQWHTLKTFYTSSCVLPNNKVGDETTFGVHSHNQVQYHKCRDVSQVQ